MYNIFYHRNVVYSLVKEQTSYDDLLDALRLGLKGLDVEETHYIDPKVAVDDNLNWVSNARSIVLRNQETSRFVAILDVNDDGEERERFCPNCEQGYGVKKRLGPKILMPGEKREPDYEEWLQCESCGLVVPVYEAKYESKLEDSIQTIDNPFDTGSAVEGVDNRRTQRRKQDRRDHNKKGVTRKTSKRFKSYGYEEDPEIQAAIDRYGSDNVNFIQ